MIAGLVRSHGSVPGWSLVVPAFWLLLEGWGFVRLRRLPSQVAAADERHRRYLEQLGYPIPVEDGDLEPTKPPFRRPPWIAAGLVVATFALMFLLACLPVLDHRASPWRLVVYGVVCVAAVVLTATAAVLCARWLPREQRWRGRIEVGLLLVIAAALAVAWTVGLVRVLFFGA